ncbi:ABC transporter permease [Clostridium algoriphilum]|uniref:ABC transporter permease n=1 Tax=Clostridium algoriphilum TaxID=198347 RepID=UPI001CF298ED|nr:ABC transporter permease [Clostridium algoriphilum]MCB2294114.1 ABC transporter permease [Clostridium algoriphilum]
MEHEYSKTNKGIHNENVPFSIKLKKMLDPKWIMILLPVAFILITTFIPMINLFKLSVVDENGFTMKYLSQVFTEQIYLKVIFLTLKIAFLVTISCLVLSYPVSYFIIKLKSPKLKKVILQLIMIPFWISLLVRTFSWIVVLQDQGVVNSILKSLGITSQPVSLVYNTTGVLIGMTHVLLPYMILNVYSTMEGIDRNLVQVAQVMGAKPTRAFWEIFFPLSVPGILSGSMLVFILALGYFITPALLGGAQDMTISMLIQNNISNTLNWSLASALALVLFLITLVLLGGLLFLMRNHPALKED